MGGLLLASLRLDLGSDICRPSTQGPWHGPLLMPLATITWYAFLCFHDCYWGEDLAAFRVLTR